METDYEILRIQIEGMYDVQNIRFGTNNQIRSYLRRFLLGLGFKGKKKDETDSVEWNDEEIRKMLQLALKKKKIEQERYDVMINVLSEADKYKELEKELERKIEPILKKEPIWQKWLINVKGINTRSVARLLKNYEYCERFDNVAKLWAYSGYHVVDGHAVKPVKGQKLNYNARAKTDMFVVGECLIRASSSYKQFYNKVKLGYQNNPIHIEKTKLHIHRMSMRKMIKLFLSHYWYVTRTLKGLPTRIPYAVEYLGHTTIIEPYEFKPEQI